VDSETFAIHHSVDYIHVKSSKVLYIFISCTKNVGNVPLPFLTTPAQIAQVHSRSRNLLEADVVLITHGLEDTIMQVQVPWSVHLCDATLIHDTDTIIIDDRP